MEVRPTGEQPDQLVVAVQQGMPHRQAIGDQARDTLVTSLPTPIAG